MKTLKINAIAVLAATVMLISCEKEELDKVSNIEEDLTQIDDQSTDFKSKAFVINDAGQRVSEEDYLKEIDNKFVAKNSEVYYENLKAKDFKKYGIDLDDPGSMKKARIRLDRYYNSFIPYKDKDRLVSFWMNFRSFGTYIPWYGDTSHNTELQLKRTKVGTRYTTRVSGPHILNVQTKKGYPDKENRLSGRMYTYTEKTSASIKRSKASTVSGKYTATAKVSSGFFGFGAEITSSIEVGGSTTTTNETTTGTEISKQVIIDYEGEVVPKGKKCDFTLFGEKRYSIQKYKVTQKPVGGFKEYFYANDGTRAVGVRNKIKSAGEVFPHAFKRGEVYTEFEVRDQYWKYWIEKEDNCRNL